MENLKSKIGYYQDSAYYIAEPGEEDLEEKIFVISTEILNEYDFVEVENYCHNGRMTKRAIWHWAGQD